MAKWVGLIIAIGSLGGAVLLGMPRDAFCQTTRSSWPLTQPAEKLQTIDGELVGIDGKNLAVDISDYRIAPANWKLAIATDDRTTFAIEYDRATLRDLKPGMRVHCVCGVDSPGGPRKLFVNAWGHAIDGVLTSVAGNKVVLGVVPIGNQPDEITFVVDGRTKVLFLPEPEKPELTSLREGKLVNLPLGTFVSVVLSNGTAEKIFVIDVPAEPMPTTQPSE